MMRMHYGKRVLGMLLLCLCMIGCGRSADGGITAVSRSKDAGKWKEALTASALSPYTIETPERVEALWESTSRKMTIHLDAQVIPPMEGEYPIAQVAPFPKDGALLERIRKTFVGERPLYQVGISDDKENWEYPSWFREDLEQQIAYQKDLLNPETSYWKELQSANPATYEQTRKRAEQYLQQSQMVLDGMPLGYIEPEQTDDMAFGVFSYPYGASSSIYKVRGEKIPAATLALNENNSQSYQINWNDSGMRYYPDGLVRDVAEAETEESLGMTNLKNSAENLPGLFITYDEAVQLSQEYLSELGIDYMQLDQSQKGTSILLLYYEERPCYVFCFSRAQGALIEQNPYLLKEQISWSSSDVDWPQESLWIAVDDEGIGSCIWNNPSILIAIANANASLLSFTDMLQAAKNGVDELAMVYRTDTDRLVSDALTITRIELGLVKILSYSCLEFLRRNHQIIH